MLLHQVVYGALLAPRRRSREEWSSLRAQDDVKAGGFGRMAVRHLPGNRERQARQQRHGPQRTYKAARDREGGAALAAWNERRRVAQNGSQDAVCGP
ncbi:hypothetical protein GCM10020219_055840 [Nonomuraea dietziae]